MLVPTKDQAEKEDSLLRKIFFLLRKIENVDKQVYSLGIYNLIIVVL